MAMMISVTIWGTLVTRCMMLPPFLSAPKKKPDRMTPRGLLLASSATTMPSNPMSGLKAAISLCCTAVTSMAPMTPATAPLSAMTFSMMPLGFIPP